MPLERKLSEEEFIIAAIKATRMRIARPYKPSPGEKENLGHFSTKLDRVARAFQKYFDRPIDEILDRMIKDQKIWAMKTTYKQVDSYRSQLVSATCLSSFPDPAVKDSGNPSLYIAGEVPRRVLGAVSNSAQMRLAQILNFVEADERPH